MSSFRSLSAPLSDASLRPLEPECERVQLGHELTPSEYQRLAQLMETRPDVRLRVYFDAPRDLGFLQYFPELRRFTNDAHQSFDLEGLRHVPKLTHLEIDAKAKTPDLAPLAHLVALRSVTLEKCRNAQVLSTLPSLEDITLVSVNLGRRALEWPAAKRVTLVRHKGVLPAMPAVEHLTINASTLSSLDELLSCTSLRSLELNTVRGLEALPDLSRLPCLRRVSMYRVRDLADVSGLLGAMGVRHVRIRDSAAAADDFQALDLTARWPAALDASRNPHSPFVRTETSMGVTVRLDAPCVAPEAFEAAGRIENGPAWGEIAARLSAGVLRFDCEADMFSATGPAEAVGTMLDALVRLTRQTSRITELLSSGGANP